MVIVFLTLIISLSLEPIVESKYMLSTIKSHGYIMFSVFWSGVYLIPSFFGALVSYKMLGSGKNLEVTLIAILSLCMATSAMLSLIMITKENYYAFIDLKPLWGELYSTIEVMVAIIVGGNGIIYLANCNDSKRSVDIFDSDYHWTGKFK